MKKLLTIVFLFVSLISFSQDTLNYKATAYSYSYKTGNEWTEYTAWKECDVMITFNFKNHTIFVNNIGQDSFTILKDEGKNTISTGDSIVTFLCRDKDNKTCYYKFITAVNNTIYSLIEYDDAKIIYGMEYL